jgi:hypothetical protein
MNSERVYVNKSATYQSIGPAVSKDYHTYPREQHDENGQLFIVWPVRKRRRRGHPQVISKYQWAPWHSHGFPTEGAR